MKNIKYIRELGYIIDVFSLFILYFNKKVFIEKSINYDKQAEDTEYYNRLFDEFSPVPDELLPFFYMKENDRTFMTKFYFYAYRQKFTTVYGLYFVQNALSDHDEVINNLFNYYFPESTKKDFEEYKQSPVYINTLISKSDYDWKMKSYLYLLFLDPIPVIEKLSKEIMSKYIKMSNIYNKNTTQISDFINNMDLDNLFLKIEKYDNRADLHLYESSFISVSPMFKDYLCFFPQSDSVLIILGTGSDEYMDYLLNKSSGVNLEVVGNVLSEKNRVEILKLMKNKGEIIIQDIERALGTSSSNSHYHLSMMLKAGMIKSRTSGRTIYYTLNKDRFDVICETLSEFSNNPKFDSIIQY